MKKRYLPVWMVSLLLVGVMGCPESKESATGPTRPTVIAGRAPLNAKGKITAICHEITQPYGKGFVIQDPAQCVGCVGFAADIDDVGRFKIEVGSAKGRVTLEATGGEYIEPASGTVVRNSTEKLHAVLTLKQHDFNQAAVTPWTEMAHARGGLDGYGESLKKLADSLTCKSADVADVLMVPPALPADGIHALTDAASLAYVYMGGFSQLAEDLSVAHKVAAHGVLLNSMRLAKVLADDFSNGSIDGRNRGDGVVFMVEDVPLPSDVLRQQLAQSVRRFLNLHRRAEDPNAWGNESSLGENAMLAYLRCICDDTDPALGPTWSKALDLDGPTLQLIVPADGSYLAASQDVVCEARDFSDVVAIDVQFLDDHDTVIEGARGGLAKAAPIGMTRRFVAPLNIEAVKASGPVTVRCTATDRWGNANTLESKLNINRGAVRPQIKLKSERAGDTLLTDATQILKGWNEITCDCQDDIYSSHCQLEVSNAAKARIHIDELGRNGRVATYGWNTGDVLDGPYELTCRNTTGGIPEPIVQTQSVAVKNHQDANVRGAVYLDTAVRGMHVDAVAYENGIEGALLGGGDLNDDGRFEFKLSTEYRGPVLFRAGYCPHPSKLATFRNIPLSMKMTCTNAELTLLVKHYDPANVSAELSGLSINVGSSMHHALAAAFWNLGEETTFEAAIERAQALVLNYFSAGSGKALDPRLTWVADLSDAGRVKDQSQEILALFHVGLSRAAVDLALKSPGCKGNPSGLDVTDILKAMRRDLADGMFDGKEHGAKILMTCDAELTPEFFRFDLARAIRRWVDKAPFADESLVPVNESGLTKHSVTAHIPVVQGFAGHHSPLFGNRPGEVFDGDGPTVEFQIYGADQKELDLSKPLGSTTLRLVVNAKHQAGISSLEVKHGGVVMTKHRPSDDKGRGEYIVSTADLEGPQTLRIVATDEQSNPPTLVTVGFTVDRVVPTVNLQTNELWIRDGNSYRVTGHVAKPRTTATITLDGNVVGKPVYLEGDAFAIDVPMVDCNVTHIIGVEVVDAAGNRHNQTQTVHCDNTPPTIGHLPSFYRQAQSGNVVELGHRLHKDFDATGLAESTDTNVLEVRWDRLDAPFKNELPTLKFNVGDIDDSTIGTAANTLRVSYKYIFRGGGVLHERDWSPVDCTREGACSVVISYQTMLPETILRQPVSVARRQNFLAYSGIDDLHSVLLKVEDLAGNVAMGEWTTRLRVFSAPIQVNECVASERLIKASLGQLKSFYDGVLPISSGKITWGTPRQHDSLTPDGYLELAITGVAKSTIERVVHSYHETSGHNDEQFRALGYALRCLEKHTENNVGYAVGWADGVCRMMSAFSSFPYDQPVGNHGETSRQRLAFKIAVGDGPQFSSGAALDGTKEATFSAFLEGELRHNEQPLSWSMAEAADGEEALLLSELFGMELHKRKTDEWGGWENTKPFTRRTLLRTLKLEQHPLTVNSRVLHGGTPQPLAIKYEEACANGASATWEVGVRPPTLKW